jgi:hypothetical protein
MVDILGLPAVHTVVLETEILVRTWVALTMLQQTLVPNGIWRCSKE